MHLKTDMERSNLYARSLAQANFESNIFAAAPMERIQLKYEIGL
jgi:hypothetical protein